MVTYDPEDNKLRLYAENEKAYSPTWTLLRGESASFTKTDTNQDITLGYSSGSGVGCNTLLQVWNQTDQ